MKPNVLQLFKPNIFESMTAFVTDASTPCPAYYLARTWFLKNPDRSHFIREELRGECSLETLENVSEEMQLHWNRRPRIWLHVFGTPDMQFHTQVYRSSVFPFQTLATEQFTYETIPNAPGHSSNIVCSSSDAAVLSMLKDFWMSKGQDHFSIKEWTKVWDALRDQDARERSESGKVQPWAN